MPNLVSFADFLASTRDVKVTPKEQLLSEATKNTYFLNRMLEGRDVKKMFKGGSKLVEKVQFEDTGTWGFYSPNDEESPTQTDVLSTIEVNWAFSRAYYVFNDEETTLNAGDPKAYVNLKRSYELARAVDECNGMEEALWASPNSDTMESVAADPKVAYSIPAYVTRDGEVPASGNGGIASGSSAWTTIANVNPTTKTAYKNKSATYTAATPDDPEAGLIAQFDDIVLQTKFQMPSGIRKYGEDEKLRKMVIATSRDGIVFYKSRLRALNDRMERLNDPNINGPQFSGIPIDYVAELDNAGWTSNQPDYFFLNLDYFFPFCHNEWYMKEKLTDGGSKQPNTYTNWSFTWYNIICRSRRHQGRVSAV